MGMKLLKFVNTPLNVDFLYNRADKFIVLTRDFNIKKGKRVIFFNFECKFDIGVF